MRSFVMPTPFTNPAAIPTSGESASATGQGTPDALGHRKSHHAQRHDRTDRQTMPAVRITRNMPIDSMPLAAVCLKMFVILRHERKHRVVAPHDGAHHNYDEQDSVTIEDRHEPDPQRVSVFELRLGADWITWHGDAPVPSRFPSFP